MVSHRSICGFALVSLLELGHYSLPLPARAVESRWPFFKGPSLRHGFRTWSYGPRFAFASRQDRKTQRLGLHGWTPLERRAGLRRLHPFGRLTPVVLRPHAADSDHKTTMWLQSTTFSPVPPTEVKHDGPEDHYQVWPQESSEDGKGFCPLKQLLAVAEASMVHVCAGDGAGDDPSQKN